MKPQNLGLFSISLSIILGLCAFNPHNRANAQTERRILQQEIEKYLDVAQEILIEASEEIEQTIETEEFKGHVAEPILKGLKGAALGASKGPKGAVIGGIGSSVGSCAGSCHNPLDWIRDLSLDQNESK